MELRRSDDRKVHLVTRGNVDGIVSAALFLARDAGTRVSFVPSGDLAVDVLRKDISSRQFYLVDLGLTPRLIKTLNDKAKGGQRVCYLDHHQHSYDLWDQLDPRTEGVVRQGISAAGVAYEYLGLNGLHKHLVAIADKVEFCPSRVLAAVEDEIGSARLDEEARILDFAWRFRVDDDRFRLAAARRLAQGKWPSDVAEVWGRYRQMRVEGRWEHALERVRERVELRQKVALLRFGRHKTSLFGFGSRALSAVAREYGAEIAVLLNRRPNQSSLSMRRTRDEEGGFNLGRFAADFPREHGVAGGGHPNSAGARIPTRVVGQFLKEVHCLA
jgi:single-stranded-DNA-specific exonuclease